MLQRAASNAYSWWWASHIRTKHSKWLEENLQDMEDKVNDMLGIIENEGDSFAQRAEMYYRKRPELIEHVENSYRAYRALAERYDKLSKELQSANRTIATVFPEQVQFDMDDYDEEIDPTRSTYSEGGYKVPNPNIPQVPSTPMKQFRSPSISMSRKGHLNRTASSSKAAAAPSSGLSKEEALEEIDRLQKEILALQTQKEFIQSVSERCHAKSCGIENQVVIIQEKISRLQDEFGIASVIDDNEARTLMATTALQSCQETLVKLQEKQEQSVAEAKREDQRIKQAQQKFTALRGEFLPGQTGLQDLTDEAELSNVDQQDVELLKEKIKKELQADLKSSVTVMQLAERIDELVDKVVNLETEVSSQSALVNTLRSETDGLQDHVKTLEEDKETLMESSEIMSKKLKELEEELRKVKCLNTNIKIQNNALQTHFTEASCSIDHLSVKLQTAKPVEEVENMEWTQEVRDFQLAQAESGASDNEERLLLGDGTLAPKAMAKEENGNDVPATSNYVRAEESGLTQKLDDMHRYHLDIVQGKRDKRRDLSETESNPDSDQGELVTDGEDQLNWRQLFMSGLDDREKLLLGEYTSVLHNYKEVRKKLGDVEKKNRDGFFELAMQIRELKNALALRDEEIQSLRKRNTRENIEDESHGSYLANAEEYPESMTQAPSFLDSNPSFLCSPQQAVFDPTRELHQTESTGKPGELVPHGSIKRNPAKDIGNEMKLRRGQSPHLVSAVEAKIRSDIDELLEENLEFWLRFSTSFHQIRKFQTSVHDLKLELSKLKHDKKPDGGRGAQAIASEARPIYKHLREILTDLTLWLENNSVLKDEMQSRFVSLCNIQEELSKVSAATSKGEEAEVSEYQAAKFQGELLNMKQESNKVAGELHAGLDKVRGLKVEVEKILSKMDDELGILASKSRSPSHRARIPLRSFLFGIKLKRQKQHKQSIFACASPALQKQYSDMKAAGSLPPAE